MVNEYIQIDSANQMRLRVASLYLLSGHLHTNNRVLEP